MPDRNCALVIEPDPEMRRRVCALLDELGCDTQFACRETFGHVTFRGCDLIVCDWDEWVATSEIPVEKRRATHCPLVLLLSRIPEESDWVRALEAGAFDLLEEPTSAAATAEFRRVVASALGRAREVHAA